MDFIEYLDYEDVRENIILNRLHFYERKQTSGETFNAYVVELLELAKKCMFDEQEEWLVRDRIIFGSLYTDLNMYLLNLGGNPSLEEIVKAYRLHEKIQADTIDDSETRATEGIDKNPWQPPAYEHYSSNTWVKTNTYLLKFSVFRHHWHLYAQRC